MFEWHRILWLIPIAISIVLFKLCYMAVQIRYEEKTKTK